MDKKPKKCLLVITKSNWGGAQRHVYNLATTLPKEEYLVSVAFGGTGVAESAPGELAERLATAKIPTHYVRAFARDVSLWSDLRALVEIISLFRQEQPDVVHLNSSKAGGVGALAARIAGIKKIIFTSHGLAWDEDRSPFAKKLIKLFSWCTFALCHAVITITQDNFDRVRALPGCSKKVVLVRNGLPTLSFEVRERARVSLALKTGLVEHSDAGSIWIGTIAELTKNKGLPCLIGAAKLLAEHSDTRRFGGQRFHIFIIGGGEQEEMLRSLIIENNLAHCVHLVGFISDAYRYDRAFDIFTLTSVKEGLPTVLLEAGQAGTPVVASDIPGAREIVTDSESGLLFPTKDAAALAEQLTLLINDPALRSRLAKNLQQKVTSQFSIAQMVEETEGIYRS